MSANNVQFSVAAHILAVLGYWPGEEVTSTVLAHSVNADPTFVRRAVSKLAKAGLLKATRGKNGACSLVRPASEITMLEVYKASQAPETFAIHGYPVEELCIISKGIKASMGEVLDKAQEAFESNLEQQTLADVIAVIKQKNKKTAEK